MSEPSSPTGDHLHTTTIEIPGNGQVNAGYEDTENTPPPPASNGRVHTPPPPRETQQPNGDAHVGNGDAKTGNGVEPRTPGSEPVKELTEAVNLELVSMQPYSNSIPIKKESTELDIGDPYDEYFVPVNQHKKYMRGEKLYVTQDKRRGLGGGKRKCCWGVLTVIVLGAIVAILLGVVLTSQEESLEDSRSFDGAKASIGGNFVSSASTTKKPIITTTETAEAFMSQAVQGELTIVNMEFTPGLANQSSSEFRNLAASLEEELKSALFDHQTLHYGSADITVKVLEFKSGSVVVIYRIGWEFKEGIRNPPDPIDKDSLKTKLQEHIRSNDGFLYNYKVQLNNLKAERVTDHCKENNGGCSQECKFDQTILQFICMCEDSYELDKDGKTCYKHGEHGSGESSSDSSEEKGEHSHENIEHSYEDEQEEKLGTNPKPEPSPSPEPSSEPEPSASPEPSSEPEPSASPEPSSEPEPSASPEPSSEPEPSASPEPSSEPEPSASPEPSAEPEPKASSEPELSVSAEPSAEPEPSASPEPSSEPEPSASPEPSAEPELSASPEPSAEPEPSASPEPSAEPEPSASPEPSSEPEPSAAPVPFAEPEPSASPEPSAEPEPSSSPEPTAEPKASAAPVPFAEPEPSASPEPSAEPEPSSSPEPTAEPKASASSEQVAEAERSSTYELPAQTVPSISPNPSAEPEPSASAEPEPSASAEPEPSASPEPEPSASPEPEPSPSPEPEPSASPELEPSASPQPPLEQVASEHHKPSTEPELLNSSEPSAGPASSASTEPMTESKLSSYVEQLSYSGESLTDKPSTTEESSLKENGILYHNYEQTNEASSPVSTLSSSPEPEHHSSASEEFILEAENLTKNSSSMEPSTSNVTDKNEHLQWDPEFVASNSGPSSTEYTHITETDNTRDTGSTFMLESNNNRDAKDMSKTDAENVLNVHNTSSEMSIDHSNDHKILTEILEHGNYTTDIGSNQTLEITELNNTTHSGDERVNAMGIMTTEPMGLDTVSHSFEQSSTPETLMEYNSSSIMVPDSSLSMAELKEDSEKITEHHHHTTMETAAHPVTEKVMNDSIGIVSNVQFNNNENDNQTELFTSTETNIKPKTEENEKIHTDIPEENKSFTIWERLEQSDKANENSEVSNISSGTEKIGISSATANFPPQNYVTVPPSDSEINAHSSTELVSHVPENVEHNSTNETHADDKIISLTENPVSMMIQGDVMPMIGFTRIPDLSGPYAVDSTIQPAVETEESDTKQDHTSNEDEENFADNGAIDDNSKEWYDSKNSLDNDFNSKKFYKTTKGKHFKSFKVEDVNIPNDSDAVEQNVSQITEVIPNGTQENNPSVTEPMPTAQPQQEMYVTMPPEEITEEEKKLMMEEKSNMPIESISAAEHVNVMRDDAVEKTTPIIVVFNSTEVHKIPDTTTKPENSAVTQTNVPSEMKMEHVNSQSSSSEQIVTDASQNYTEGTTITSVINNEYTDMDRKNKTCSSDEIMCKDGSKCIAASMKCDGKADCEGGSDELGCDDECLNKFKCNDGKCIEKSFVCDSVMNCEDGSDENSCAIPSTNKPQESEMLSDVTTTISPV